MIKSICIWFSKKNTLSIQDSVIKLKEVCDMQQQLIQKYDKEIDIVKRKCKIAIDNKATKAEKLYYIKKIKIIQYHQESLRKRLLACTEKQYHLESMQITVSHIDAIKTATGTLKQFMKETDVQKVEELQENMSELIADACEIQNIVSEDINQDHSWTEEELEKELEDLNHDESLFSEVSLDTPTPSIDIENDDIDVSTPLMNTRQGEQDFQNVKIAVYA
tara:strand:- start:4886 stop:5545 length:660 start_codon:yes stop_codon:yes gene_type:complete